MSGDGLSRSMGPAVGYVGLAGKDRKRHRSAGDHHHVKARSNSLIANWKMKHTGEEKGLMSGSGGDREQSAGALSEVVHAGTDMQDISEEIKDSGVGLDDNDTMSDGPEGGDRGDLAQKGGDSEGNGGEQESSLAGDVVNRLHKQGHIADIKSRSNSLKSATSSPLHSTATPVTENDPLGLFTEPTTVVPATQPPTVRKSPEKIREQFVAQKPFEADSNVTNKNLTKLDLGLCNNDSLPPDGNQHRVENSTGETIIEKVLSPVEKVQKSLFKIERTNSFPENLSTSVKTATPSKSEAARSEVASLGRSSCSLHEPKTEPLPGTPRSVGLFRTGSFRRHKDNFSGMLKFATGAVATKLTEMLTPTKIGSNNSLDPSYDESDSETDSYRETRRKKGSFDYLHRSSDRLDSNSINGLHGM